MTKDAKTNEDAASSPSDVVADALRNLTPDRRLEALVAVLRELSVRELTRITSHVLGLLRRAEKIKAPTTRKSLAE